MDWPKSRLQDHIPPLKFMTFQTQKRASSELWTLLLHNPVSEKNRMPEKGRINGTYIDIWTDDSIKGRERQEFQDLGLIEP